jgi:hypothetical protein
MWWCLNLKKVELEPIRKVLRPIVTFYNRQYALTERMLEYYRPIVTFTHAIIDFSDRLLKHTSAKTEDVGSFGEDLEATLNEHTCDLYCGYEEIPAQQTSSVREAFIDKAECHGVEHQ